MSDDPPSRPPESGLPEAPVRPVWLYALALVVAVGVVYANSLGGAFVLDDVYAIVENQALHAGQGVSVLDPNQRPVVAWSLQLNHALGEALVGDGLWAPGYHAFNVLIHVLAALALFGLLRRSLLRGGVPWLAGRAAPVAAGVALLWALHPLQTQAVTYVIQRAESMVTLALFLVLYLAARDEAAREAGGPRWGWILAACAAGIAGAWTKQVMAVAPVVLLLYDRAFLAGSFAGALNRRWPLYAVLLLGAVWQAAGAFAPGEAAVDPGGDVAAGFGLTRHTWWQYVITQPTVILHYLRLVFVPQPLIFDYGWDAYTRLWPALPGLVAVGVLLVATLVALVRWPRVGAVAASFFLILAPSSSIIPIADVVVEHRMYGPSAAVLVLAALAVLAGLRYVADASGPKLAAVLAAVLAVAFGIQTISRNFDYHEAETLWADTADKAPDNPRAHHNLANVYFTQGRMSEALDRYWRTLQIEPRNAGARVNLGIALMEVGRYQDAHDQFQEALRHWPEYPEALRQLGILAERTGALPHAARFYERMIAAGVEEGAIRNTLGTVYAQLGRLEEAAAQFARALELEPWNRDAAANLEQARQMLASQPAASAPAGEGEPAPAGEAPDDGANAASEAATAP